MKRAAKRLSSSLEHRLSGYALAATAAGVSMLALAPAGEAKIVYTRTRQVIEPKEVCKIDLNHDGKIDFAIKNLTRAFTSTGIGSLLVGVATSGRGVEGTAGKGYFFASPLSRGARIPNSGKFAPVGRMMAQAVGWFGTTTSGLWVNVTNRYLGLKFNILGKTHYGWARLSVSLSNYTITATLTGYAYETIANKPIIAGKIRESGDAAEITASLNAPATTTLPATLGRLALGSHGLPAWWRRD